MQYSVSHSSRLGNRKVNQDRCLICSRGQSVFLILADGMGGHEGGELAAQTFVDCLQAQFKMQAMPIKNPRDFLVSCTLKAHLEIKKIETKSGQSPRTTCVCCLIQNGETIWLHSGDSRLYLIRNKRVYLRTHDHTHVENLLSNHIISEEEVNTHPMRNYVTACIGSKKTTPHTSISQISNLKANDIILLCSDGLWSGLDNEEILRLVNQTDIELATDQLTQTAESKTWPKSDNISALSFRFINATEKENSLEKLNKKFETIPPNKANDEQNSKQNDNSINQAIDDINIAYQEYQDEIKKS